jgi:uncharacterized cupin superfamily protein
VRALPGGQTSPVHAHRGEEEIFYVLGGSGRLCWYPDSRKLSVAGIIFRVEQVDYWDGEE